MLTPSDASLGVREVAARLGVTPRTVRTMCAQKRLPHVALPGPSGRVRYRFREVDIAAWLARHEQKAVR